MSKYLYEYYHDINIGNDKIYYMFFIHKIKLVIKIKMFMRNLISKYKDLYFVNNCKFTDFYETSKINILKY